MNPIDFCNRSIDFWRRQLEGYQSAVDDYFDKTRKLQERFPEGAPRLWALHLADSILKFTEKYYPPYDTIDAMKIFCVLLHGSTKMAMAAVLTNNPQLASDLIRGSEASMAGIYDRYAVWATSMALVQGSVDTIQQAVDAMHDADFDNRYAPTADPGSLLKRDMELVDLAVEDFSAAVQDALSELSRLRQAVEGHALMIQAYDENVAPPPEISVCSLPSAAGECKP